MVMARYGTPLCCAVTHHIKRFFFLLNGLGNAEPSDSQFKKTKPGVQTLCCLLLCE